jgi:PAS domain S-box-containing protein
MEREQPAADFKTKFEECNGRFESIFSHTSAASKIINRDLRIIKVNDALVDLLGYTADEILGTEIMDYACPDVKHHWKELQDAMWNHGRPFFKLDACLVRKDKKLAWVHVTTILFKEDNEHYGFTVLDDFTNQKTLEETERRLSMALQNSKMAVWELNLQDSSIIYTEGLKQLFGIQEQLIHWDLNFLLRQFVAEDEHRLRIALQAINSATILDFQGRIHTHEGVLKWVYLQGKPGKCENGKAFNILGTITDITKEKLAERDKDDFISIASHELRTPITALKASLQLLQTMKHAQDGKAASLVTQANKSMGKISLLIDDLLNVSNLKEGQLKLKKTRFKIANAIDECCHHVTAAGVFNITTEGDPDIEVEADSERIQQVVVNFVNNAMKYAHGTKEIKIRVEKKDAQVVVSVTDHGPGIEKEKLPFLFDRFYRADISAGQYSGLGLGLYISAEIIRRHHGTIGVESEPGKGATFWFSIPQVA